ncbi:MAG TPA: isochorismate synthase [Solirubrobacteraceae bacterium]|jgi:isochorismate synthase|nr:isochorismate synthase [Solirubrobacteraceae bacterium]
MARISTDTPPSARADSPFAPFLLANVDRERLSARLQLAVKRARRSGRETLAALTLALPAGIDPSAVVAASRRPGEPWFLLEQPERGARVLAALGEVVHLTAAGKERFATVADRWRALAAAAVGDPPEESSDLAAAGAGPVALGGFAFAPAGGEDPTWSGFAPASLVVPEVALTRRRSPTDGRDHVRMMVCALAAPDDTAQELLARLERRVGELRERPLPLLDPAPAGRYRVASAMPPEHYEAAVARAVELIRAGRLEKVVLAREVQVHASGGASNFDPAALFGVLREGFPSCTVFCVGRDDAAFVAASPELLVRREGHRVSTLALAGSMRRSADPAVDDHLGAQLMHSEKDREEHAIVIRRIERTLRQHALWTAAPPDPTLVKVANIQHLATPIRAQLAQPLDVIELLELMHPTPAVGGEPLATARPLIPALEGLDRGWYAGPVGWADATGDGEFCVALRCALLRDRVARCYAGVGVVRDSDPAAELAETEVKLAALLPLLAG